MYVQKGGFCPRGGLYAICFKTKTNYLLHPGAFIEVDDIQFDLNT